MEIHLLSFCFSLLANPLRPMKFSRRAQFAFICAIAFLARAAFWTV